MSDLTPLLQGEVKGAFERGTPLVTRGGGTKGFLGPEVEGVPLELAGHSGIVDYQPRELVVTARAGTPLRELEATLAEAGQMLPFEPPRYGEGATLGGTLAAGLSGPRRPWAGAARDFTLGVRLINGRGEVLRFGGTVMKNVAGYDVSRLVVGSFGTLGVILEASLKVLPRPEADLTLVQGCDDAAEAIERVNRWAGQPLPLTATCHHQGRLHLRLEGTPTAVEAARCRLGGEPLVGGERFWEALREQRLPFFSEGEGRLWRLSLPSTAPLPRLEGVWLVEWGGALRWLRTTAPAERVQAAAAATGGHATLWRGEAVEGVAPFQPLPRPLLNLHRLVARAFDPSGILNPGKLFPLR